ncbi:hypothetical protein Pmar_PMAR009628 [Perkinsus marinus ATCC 50983]|uniref:Uncharacterized protein n=1 Tax=Perkinsus marinus (strain ATCC 50983 / TXsc) TaxID=423536 RepID=C5M011_PERM5|nr:hypothetical protein Pmar_PMAR009628 [Perkinsus marinus ATCC 50983]EEQ97669.1 hypothetical protein Pmar_PMAR009628 [Perkinsus marinus ATCC 50983]|eukprot:XP_002764952.1 hypothetical protein Pmar_PMAR009628 [Perkinsus marinus ATCC 50983]
MWTALLSGSLLFVGSVAVHHYEFHMETTLYCVEGLTDFEGKPHPCSKSIASNTAGMTLPGMDDGKSLMFKSHLVIGSDGSEARIDAHPAYPYQYFMTTTTPELVSVHSLRNGESFFIGSAPPQAHNMPIVAGGSLSLKEDGWTFHSTVVVGGARQHTWVKEGFKGVDPATGFNHSHVHDANLAPDTWTLTMDEREEKPLKLVASNSKHGHAHHQVVVFTHFEKREGSLTSKEAEVRLYNAYQVPKNVAPLPSRRLMTAQEHLQILKDAAGSLLSGHIPSDPGRLIHSVGWLRNQHFRTSKIIKYFAHNAGKAAVEYFANGAAPRAPPGPAVAFDFQFPRGCETSARVNSLCIAIKVSAAGSKHAEGYLHVQFPNVERRGLGAILDLSIKMEHDPFVIDLNAHGTGCSVVFKLGSAVYISVTVCVHALGGCNRNVHTGVCTASVVAWAHFTVHLPRPVGNIIQATLTSTLALRAGPKNFVEVKGGIGTSASIPFPSASASIRFNYVAVTFDQYLERWKLTAGLTFDAGIRLLFWRPSWHKYYPLISHTY